MNHVIELHPLAAALLFALIAAAPVYILLKLADAVDRWHKPREARPNTKTFHGCVPRAAQMPRPQRKEPTEPRKASWPQEIDIRIAIDKPLTMKFAPEPWPDNFEEDERRYPYKALPVGFDTEGRPVYANDDGSIKCAHSDVMLLDNPTENARFGGSGPNVIIGRPCEGVKALVKDLSWMLDNHYEATVEAYKQFFRDKPPMTDAQFDEWSKDKTFKPAGSVPYRQLPNQPLPCPFCGIPPRKTAATHHELQTDKIGRRYGLRCTNRRCKADIEVFGANPDEALKMWNTRCQ